jgi:hypothetical protein
MSRASFDENNESHHADEDRRTTDIGQIPQNQGERNYPEDRSL